VFKGIILVSVILVVYLKTSPLNKLIPFTTSIQCHTMTLTPLHTIGGGGITQNFPTKP